MERVSRNPVVRQFDVDWVQNLEQEQKEQEQKQEKEQKHEEQEKEQEEEQEQEGLMSEPFSSFL